MTSKQNRKRAARHTADALGVKYTEALRVVEAQKAGLLPRIPTQPAVGPGAYDPLYDALYALSDVEPAAETVEVATFPLLNLLSYANYQYGEIERALVDCLASGFGVPATFSVDSPTNPVNRAFAEAVLDLCAAMGGERLDHIDQWLFQGHLLIEGLEAPITAAGAIYAALDGSDATDVHGTSMKLSARYRGLLQG